MRIKCEIGMTVGVKLLVKSGLQGERDNLITKAYIKVKADNFLSAFTFMYYTDTK